jgi:DNA primase
VTVWTDLPEAIKAGRPPAVPADSKPPAKPPEQPSGLPLAEASTLVDEAAACLWGSGGGTARDYLRGRGLTEATVRAAGLGFTPAVSIPTRAGDRCFMFSGIVIPWRDGARLTRIKIRRIDEGKPRYAEAYSDHPLIYPDPAVIRPGKPLIVSEGEFDAMLLGQQLPEASVITLGSTSARTDPAVLSRMLSSPRWFIALDADQAGDSAASKFPARAIRVRPPDPDKDWGEVHRGGANRVRYLWGRYLSMSRKWEELEPKGDLV